MSKNIKDSFIATVSVYKPLQKMKFKDAYKWYIGHKLLEHQTDIALKATDWGNQVKCENAFDRWIDKNVL